MEAAQTTDTQTLHRIERILRASPTATETFVGLFDNVSKDYLERMIEECPTLVIASFGARKFTGDVTADGIALCIKYMQNSIKESEFLTELERLRYTGADYIIRSLFALAKRHDGLTRRIMSTDMFTLFQDGKFPSIYTMFYVAGMEYFPKRLAAIIPSFGLGIIDIGHSPHSQAFVNAIASQNPSTEMYYAFAVDPVSYYIYSSTTPCREAHRKGILDACVEVNDYTTFFLCYGGETTKEEEEQIAKDTTYRTAFTPRSKAHSVMNLLRVIRQQGDKHLLSAAEAILIDISAYRKLYNAVTKLRDLKE